MDGLVVLVLIGWLLKSVSAKNKKKKTAKKISFDAGRVFPASGFPKSEQKIAPAVPEEKQMEAVQEAFIPLEGEGSFRQPWSGSLEMESDEGKDLCDPSLGHERTLLQEDPESVYANEIGSEPLLDTTPRGLMQGVIMSEILARPALRKRR